MVTKDELYERRYKHIAEQMGYMSSGNYYHNQAIRTAAESGMTTAQRRKDHERRQKEYEAGSAFNQLPYDKKIARRQARSNAKETIKETAKTVGATLKQSGVLKKMFNPITIAATAAAAAINLLSKSAKLAAKQAEQLALATKTSTDSLKNAEAYQQLNRAAAESSAAFERLKTAIGTGTSNVKEFGAKLAGIVDDIGVRVGWALARITHPLSYTDSYSEAKQSHTNAYVSAAKEGYITSIYQTLLGQGVGDKQSQSLAQAAYNSAKAAAMKTPGNEGLTESEIINSAAFKTYMERYSSLAQGANSNIFEGAAAQMLGTQYVPGMIRSQEEQAKILEYIMRQLAGTNSVEEQAELMSTWENAGTLLNNLAQNLYSFDEVISNKAIQVNDEKVRSILQGIINDYNGRDDLLRDLERDVADIRDNLANPDGTDSGTGGTGGTGDQSSFGQGGGRRNTDDTGSTGYHGQDLYHLTGVNNITGAWTGKEGWENAADIMGNLYNVYTHADGSIEVLQHKYKTIEAYEEALNSDPKYIKSDISLGSAFDLDKRAVKTGVQGLYEKGMHDVEADRYANNIAALGRVDSPTLDALSDKFRNDALTTIGSETPSPYDLYNSLKPLANTPSNNMTINVNLSGINIADNDRQWNEVARNIGERINTIERQEGGI
jgi:hypothetical protein